MSTQQLINLLILVLFFGLPAIGHIAKKMIEKREELKRRHASELAQREALRTGKIDSSRPASGNAGQVAIAAGTQQQAEAARKQAQLQEMRRRQQERLRQAAAQRQRGSVPAPAQRQPTARPTAQQRPGQPSIRTQTPIQTQQRQVPQTVARGPSRPTEQAARVPQARSKYGPETPPAVPREDLRARLERRQREDDAAKAATKIRRNEGRTVQRRPDRASVHEGAWEKQRDDTFSWDAVEEQGVAHLLGRKMSPQDWRNAVIMQEVLARPVSLRERGEQGIF